LIDALLLQRQPNFESCSFSHLRLTGDFSAVFPDDYLIGDREPEAGAFADGLSPEKGIEHFRLNGGVHAIAVVDNRDDNAIAFSHRCFNPNAIGPCGLLCCILLF